MKKIEKTYGGVCLNENGDVIAYFGGYSEDGFIFRDDEAKDNEVCYIPELMFDKCSEEHTLTKEEAEQSGYTFNELMHLVYIKLDYEGVKVSRDRLEEITRNVLGELTWLCAETYLQAAELLA